MASLISRLLKADEPLFSISIDQLEKVSGKHGIDVNLISELRLKPKQKIKELGLDPEDTTGEVVTLVQTAKMPPVPIILVGSDFWNPVNDFVKTKMLDEFGVISHGDEELYYITDDIDEIRRIVDEHRETTSVFALPPKQPAKQPEILEPTTK